MSPNQPQAVHEQASGFPKQNGGQLARKLSFEVTWGSVISGRDEGSVNRSGSPFEIIEMAKLEYQKHPKPMPNQRTVIMFLTQSSGWS